LDVSPGDRANACGGVMRPVSAVKNRKGFVVIFRCEKCGAIGKNKAAEDDDKELIIELTATPFKE
jgi:hypothetical protein